MDDVTLPKLTTMLYSCVSSTMTLLASTLQGEEASGQQSQYAAMQISEARLEYNT